MDWIYFRSMVADGGACDADFLLHSECDERSFDAAFGTFTVYVAMHLVEDECFARLCWKIKCFMLNTMGHS